MALLHVGARKTTWLGRRRAVYFLAAGLVPQPADVSCIPVSNLHFIR